MATVTYNGVQIQQCKITRFAFENEYEGDNFNRTGKKCTLEGVGIVSGSGASAWSTNATLIRADLSVPGKALSITFDDTASTIALADGYQTAGGVQDVKNGPLPSVNITEVVGTSNQVTFVVGFSFVFNDCNNSPIQRCEVITTHSLNEDGVLRVTRRGFLRVSASNKGTNTLTTSSPKRADSTSPFLPPLQRDGNNPGAGTFATSNSPSNPDLYRRLVAGPPAVGFQRTKQEFYVQADQTTLAFDIEDVQLINTLPTPAINGDASFEYQRGINIQQGEKTFRIELVGTPSENKATLFLRALEVALTRIRFVSSTPDTATGRVAPPDMVHTIKISEPSLFKRNAIILEIVAYGQMTGTATNEPSAPDKIDSWLYQVLFSNPTTSVESTGTTVVDPYGAFKNNVQPPTFTAFQFDPCALSNVWRTIVGVGTGTQVQGATPPGTPPEPTTPPDTTKTDPRQPDAIQKKQAASMVHYKASQSMDIVTNVDLLDAMGGDIQSAFQIAMPYATVRQTVEMATRDRNAVIAWPYLNEEYVVISLNVAVNDAPPDTSGNRVYIVRADRTLRVNVAVSNNNWITGGVTGSNPPSGGSNETTTRLINYMPSSMVTPRNPISGFDSVDVRSNVNGIAVRQNYASGPTVT